MTDDELRAEFYKAIAELRNRIEALEKRLDTMAKRTKS